MGGMCHIKTIIMTGFQLISGKPILVFVLGVIGGKSIRSKGQGNSVAFTGSQQLGFCKGSQHFFWFFNAARRVRRVRIELHHVFAGCAAHIGHLDLYGIFFTAVHIGICDFARICQFPVKLRVAQTIAKGKDYILPIPFFPIIHSAGFIIAVTYVDIFLIVYKVVALCFAIDEIAVTVLLIVVTEVLEGRHRFQISHIGIHGFAGGIHLAAEDFTHSRSPGSARETDPQSRVNFGSLGEISFIGQEGQLHRGAAVNEYDHALKARIADRRKQIPFILIQLKISILSIHSARDALHGAGQIEAFAAHTGEHHQRGVAVILVAGFYIVGVQVQRCFTGRNGQTLAGIQVGRVGLTGWAGFAGIFIKSF